ncbi:hypothetical protein BH11MYX4_BH11MYX4_02670 [soil metagenome]
MLILAASCTRFSADPVDDGGVDASGDANIPEAGNVDGASPRCAVTFCEDFEGESWKSAWTKAGAVERLDVTPGPSVSGQQALDLVLAGDTPVILVHALGPVRHVKLTARMTVLQRGDGEIDLVNIVSGAGLDAPGIHLVHAANAKLFAVEPVGSTATVVAAMFAGFGTVQLEVDLVAGTFAWRIDQESGGGSFSPKLTASSLYISLGASFAQQVKAPWHIRFDDVTVDAL